MEVKGKVLPRVTEEINFFFLHVLFFCGKKKNTRNLQKDKVLLPSQLSRSE